MNIGKKNESSNINKYGSYDIIKEEDERENAIGRKGLHSVKSASILNPIQSSKMKLSNRSRNLIILRVLILFFMCIYFPLELIFGQNFNNMENKFIFSNLDSILPDFLKYKNVVIITDLLVYLFSDKDMIALYSGVFYMVFHPFIAVKIIFVTHFVQFIFVVMRCMYQAYRPMWVAPSDLTFFCLNSYANPSMHYFYVTFFYLYSVISVHLLNKKKRKLTKAKKFFIFYFLFLFAIIYGFLIIMKRINYLYQLFFAFTMSMILIVICLDLENLIHNYIFNSLKNIFKIRKYKIQLFLIILSINIFSIFVYNFIQVETLDLYSNNNSLKNCSENQASNLGLKATFNEITYNYGILGAYWGVSLTIERNSGEWWNSSFCYSFIKILITLFIGGLYIYIFSFYNSASFEFTYFVFTIKYFVFNFILMGLLPLLFDKCKINKQINKSYIKKKSIFTQSSFLNNNNTDSRDFDKTPEFKKKELYTKTIIVGGVEAKQSLENLEFLIGKQTYNEGNGDLINEGVNISNRDSVLENTK